MYFRLKKTPSGQVLQLIESYRTISGKPRQRVIISLGNAQIPRGIQSIIAKKIQNHLNGCIDLFSTEDTTADIKYWIDYVLRLISAKPNSTSNTTEVQVDGVLLDEVQHETVSELGPELVALEAWKSLGFDTCLKNLGFNGSQCMDATVTVINRLVSSVSEHRLEDWLPQTALPELLSEKILRRGDDRYYRISDKLLSNQSSIEAHVRSRQSSLFSLDRSILLYDLTNTHFEGMCKRNPKAKHGKNKQKRNDCRQVVIGMVFDGSGFELGHKMFDGNQSDSKSLLEMISSLEECTGNTLTPDSPKPIVILDGGISSQKNLSLLRKHGFSYLVNDSRRKRIYYESHFSQLESFELVTGRDKKPGVFVRMIDEETLDESGQDPILRERVLLCRSDARREKERTIVSNAEKRFIANLEKLRSRIISGQLVDKKKVERAAGRIQAKHPRIQRYYEVEITGNQRAEDVIWTRKDEDLKRSSDLYGCYVIRTDIDTLTDVELWNLYITLTRAEEGFQALKRDLGLRPNRHHKEDRVDGHIFISVLAYQLMCYISRRLEETGDQRDWDTIRRILRTHCYTTIILPTKSGAVYRIRKAAEPEECQKEIYTSLGIDWKNLPTIKTKYNR
jgi:transposase